MAKRKRLGHRLLWLALRSFSWEFHPMKCLREVLLAVWVHGYAGEDVASFCLRG